MITRFLLKENANEDDIRRRFQVQSTDGAYSIQNVRRWCQFITQGREDLQDDPKSTRPPNDFINTKILPAWREPFHFAHSFAEVLGVSYFTIIRHLRDSLGMRKSHLRWMHMN
jgi:hypothetical protein